MAWWNSPLISPAMGFYILLAIGVVCALGWIVGRMLNDRRIDFDPIEQQFERDPAPRSGARTDG